MDLLVKKEDSGRTLSKVLNDLMKETLNSKKFFGEVTESESDDLDAKVINKQDADFVLRGEEGQILKEFAVKVVKSKYFDGQNSLL